jgi:signal transduction histidine kinase
MDKKYTPLLSKEVDYQNIAETIVRMAPAYRNPFVAIIGYGEALLEGLSGQLTEAQSKDIEAVCVSGWQALGQLNDILEVMQIISGEIIYDDLPIDIQQLFRDIERDIERTRSDHMKPLVVDIKGDISSVSGDEQRLRQALLGIIGNAMQCVPDVSVRLTISSNDKEVLIQIRDGCQVANVDDLAYFFEPGWVSKIENNRWRQMEWQSYLAHQFVVANKGKIWVEAAQAEGEGDSTLPAGTQISISIPVSKADTTDAPATPS